MRSYFKPGFVSPPTNERQTVKPATRRDAIEDAIDDDLEREAFEAIVATIEDGLNK